jgi:hypothetical protein
MPSPSGNLLKVLIRASPWLQPDTSTPLTIPDSIRPNQEVLIPGQLRAFIRHEWRDRLPGQALLDTETVSLIGYSERLCRLIPEFSGGVKIDIRYPIEMTAPIYHNCITKAHKRTASYSVICPQPVLSANVLT